MQRKVIKSIGEENNAGQLSVSPWLSLHLPAGGRSCPRERRSPAVRGKHPFPCDDRAVRRMSCRNKPYSDLAVASPPPMAIVLLEVLAYRGFVNRKKISVMGIQVIILKKKKILPGLHLAFLFFKHKRFVVFFFKNGLRIMSCGPDLARCFGRRRRSAAAHGAVPCWRCTVLPRPGLHGEKKPRLASARRWLLCESVAARLAFLKKSGLLLCFSALWLK